MRPVETIRDVDEVVKDLVEKDLAQEERINNIAKQLSQVQAVIKGLREIAARDPHAKDIDALYGLVKEKEEPTDLTTLWYSLFALGACQLISFGAIAWLTL